MAILVRDGTCDNLREWLLEELGNDCGWPECDPDFEWLSRFGQLQHAWLTESQILPELG
jgi:hypothetical protein